MDDFVVNVRQIVQYPRKSTLAQTDLLLVQESDAQGIAAGAYKSAFVSDLMKTALMGGGFIRFKPDGSGGLQFNGATFTFNGGSFFANMPVEAPGFTIHNKPVATQAFVLEQTGAIINEINGITNHIVFSFNGRTGNILLEDVDILRGRGVAEQRALLRKCHRADSLESAPEGRHHRDHCVRAERNLQLADDLAAGAELQRSHGCSHTHRRRHHARLHCTRSDAALGQPALR